MGSVTGNHVCVESVVKSDWVHILTFAHHVVRFYSFLGGRFMPA